MQSTACRYFTKGKWFPYGKPRVLAAALSPRHVTTKGPALALFTFDTLR